jgi:hypothetical protein
MRAQRSAPGAWLSSVRVPCAALCGPVRRGTAQRGERTGNARARRRTFLHPEDSASTQSSPTDDIHSAGTPCVSPPALLPSTPAERPQLSLLRSQRLIMASAHPLPAASAASLAPPAPQAGGPLPSARASCHLRRPPAPCTLCDCRTSSQPPTPIASSCPSPALPPRLAAPARSRQPYCAC